MGTVIVPSSDYPLYGDIFNMQGENSMWGIPITSNIAQLAADQDHHELQRGRNIAMDMFDEYAEGGNGSVRNEEFSHISNVRNYQKENSYIINVDSNNLILDGVINTLFSPLTELHDSDELCSAKNDLIASSTVLDSENLLMLPAPFSFHAPDQSTTASASDQQSNPCLSSSYEPSALMPSLDFLSHVHDTSDHIASSCNSRSAACSTNSLQAFNDPKLRSMQPGPPGLLQATCDHPQLKPCNSMQSACDHPSQLKPCSSMQEFDDHRGLLQDRESPLDTSNIPCNCAPNHHLDHYSALYSINNGASAAMRSCSGLLPSCKMVANHEGVQEESLNNIQEKNCSDQHTVSDRAGYDSVCDHGSYTSISDHLKIDGVRDYVICDQGHDGMCDQGQIDHMVCDHGSYPNHMKMMQREAVYAAAALQPVDWASILAVSAGTRPKRRNVRISHDPQTVSARRRRERISDRIRVLQRLVPGGTSMDTASMLDEAIHYLKFLKSQVQALEWLERGSSTLPLSASSSASSCFYPNFTRISLPNHRLIK